MDRVRLIALDMDGTLLLSDHHTVPQRNIDAIRRADALGIRVAISTGRMVEDASDFIRRYDLPCMIVAANGARACDAPMPGGRMLYRCHLAPEDAHRALDILIPSGLMINGFEDGIVHTVGGEDGRKYHLVYRGLIKAQYGEESIRKAADRGIMKLFAVGDGGFAGDVYDPRVEPVRHEILKALPHLQITSSAPANIEITSPQAGKGTALAHVAEHYGWTRENVMAMGDAGNDLNMLQYAYHSVAMGNASEEVLAACRYRTATNDECGVALMIEKVIEAHLASRRNHDAS
ncbi:MAG: HAD family phosphatase [Clostridia bacterium]|nr:HAD family phosphatase [Clostridia bacterium]MBQ6859929.1 HAD family phosphatase [Clostridia bacterium]